jgi:translation initiation factor SUI1
MDQPSKEATKQTPRLGMGAGIPTLSVKGGAKPVTGIQSGVITTNPKTILESSNTENKKIVNSEVHLEIKKRVKNKAITYVKGLPESLDKEKLLKTWRTKYSCNCSVDETGTISLAGDRREDVANYLIENGITLPEYIKIHGY